jgi:uncharacterized membrane protein (DUF373 family)
MIGEPIKEKIIWRFEYVVVTALEILLMVSVALAGIFLFVLLARGLRTQLVQIQSVSMLLDVMQSCFAGVLTVLLGLELLETLKTYFKEHHVRIEVILVVVIIALGRQMIQVELDHTSAPVLFGLAALVLALTAGYFLVKKAQTLSATGSGGPADGATTPTV